MKTHHPVRSMRKQRGLVAVIVTIALFSFMGIAALAVDINHALMNRTKLQNSVDSAALAAALVLDRSDFTSGTAASALAIASGAAKDALAQMATADGNAELDFVSAPVEVNITLANRADLTGGYDPAGDDHYVRVAVNNLSLNSFVMQIFGLNKQLSASAVAGPSAGGGSCNLVPMAVCEIDASDTDNSGFDYNSVYALKLATNTSDMGAGNFQLLNYDTDDKLSEQLAGSFQGCASVGNTVRSKPGNTVGPVGDGLNMRFGDKSNLEAADFPADSNTTEAELSDLYKNDHKDVNTITDVFEKIAEAETALANNINPKNNKELTDAEVAEYEAVLADYPLNSQEDLTLNYEQYQNTGNDRRRLAVPIIDCSADAYGDPSPTGASDYNVKSVGCFFLLQRAPTNSGDKQEIYGEYLEKCPTPNVPYNGVSNSLGTYRIVLYDDPFNKES
ncbi:MULTISPECIES: pilus assembly protein TadG-related protein [Vibrio]|uniref:Pilus assembly protein n=1 Tax=Vibrio diazotrophicus TaxID=685 RepID=A0A329ECK3_VIBDI|nr:pilus assembly protein TadG-related protein [Vibrio diazotrophicus]PNI02006.1 pilus assembly protein [Vibrio diazotrophicus]RAS66603.1 putative Flp pilus-assembly TadE/G-like protein [Vibrio diazotrophicus]